MKHSSELIILLSIDGNIQNHSYKYGVDEAQSFAKSSLFWSQFAGKILL